MPQSTLRHFELTILKPKSPADPSRVPAESARVDFYRQGATVVAQATVGPSGTTQVSVYDAGKIQAGDLVQGG